MFAPYAAGSGISEIKCIIGKAIMPQICICRSSKKSLICNSWFCNERILGWLDTGYEKYWSGKFLI